MLPCWRQCLPISCMVPELMHWLHNTRHAQQIQQHRLLCEVTCWLLAVCLLLLCSGKAKHAGLSKGTNCSDCRLPQRNQNTLPNFEHHKLIIIKAISNLIWLSAQTLKLSYSVLFMTEKWLKNTSLFLVLRSLKLILFQFLVLLINNYAIYNFAVSPITA